VIDANLGRWRGRIISTASTASSSIEGESNGIGAEEDVAVGVEAGGVDAARVGRLARAHDAAREARHGLVVEDEVVLVVDAMQQHRRLAASNAADLEHVGARIVLVHLVLVRVFERLRHERERAFLFIRGRVRASVLVSQCLRLGARAREVWRTTSERFEDGRRREVACETYAVRYATLLEAELFEQLEAIVAIMRVLPRTKHQQRAVVDRR